jgi:phospholipase C
LAHSHEKGGGIYCTLAPGDYEKVENATVIRFPLLLTLIALGGTSGILPSLEGCAGVSSHIPVQPDRHVVVIVQENRTPDNLFQDPVLLSRQPPADIAQSGLNSSGQTIQLSPVDLAASYDLNHSHKAFESMYDGGKMDGANLIPVTCDNKNCPPPNLPPNPQYVFVNPSEVEPYFQLAEQYTFGDRMFQTNQGPSFPAHQFILSGTSAPTATSNLFASENVSPGTERQTSPYRSG